MVGGDGSIEVTGGGGETDVLQPEGVVVLGCKRVFTWAK